ncbi:MAG: hypothetical protein JWO89_3816, partial [Verrucomicrobiaceae bacterium]|nr:hypothetical protein [Verrucomicrobiaceae bacterium]
INLNTMPTYVGLIDNNQFTFETSSGRLPGFHCHWI